MDDIFSKSYLKMNNPSFQGREGGTRTPGKEGWRSDRGREGERKKRGKKEESVL